MSEQITSADSTAQTEIEQTDKYWKGIALRAETTVELRQFGGQLFPSELPVSETPTRAVARYRRFYRMPQRASDRIQPLQQWEGVVDHVENDTFYATIRDLTARGTDEQIAVQLEEISGADRELVSPGAPFYWTIAYRDRIDGQRLRVSEFRFRRTRTVSQSEIDEATRRADQLSKTLGW